MVRKVKFKLLIIFGLTFFGSSLFSQSEGCTDPQASNFNPSATENDGSCNYPYTDFNPPFKYILSNTVSETSALIYLKNKLWTLNDSGGLPVLYAMDTATGQIIQEVTITNAINVDWEELAIDEDYIYIGDFGNNDGTRDDLGIYKVLIDDLPYQGNGSVTASHITYIYPDQKSFNRNYSHNFDCEAFIATEDSLYLFSKNRADYKTKLYRLPKEPGNFIAELITSFDVNGLITGAGYSITENEVVLIGYVQNIYTPFVWLLFDFQSNSYFSGNKRRIDFPNLTTTQTEGICYISGKDLMISAEKSPTFTARVFRFNASAWTDHVSHTNEIKIAKRATLKVFENPVGDSILKLSLVDCPKGNYRVDITDLLGKIVFQTSVEIDRVKEQSLSIKLPELSQGNYLVSFISNSRIISETFVIQ